MDESAGLVVATERYGSGRSWRYSVTEGVMKRRSDRGEDGSARNSLLGFFKSVFLPQGYPESVSGDYLQYQLWDTLQAFSSSLSGTLATQASLRGVGVGNQEATVAAATVTWLLRDGTGMLGRILFAWRKGSKLDSEAKKWRHGPWLTPLSRSLTARLQLSRLATVLFVVFPARLFADALNDVAMLMEILAPHFPACFMLIVCTAGIFKSIVGVAGGATRAALTVHQARRDNMADISAKDGSQETLVSLAGLLVSLLLIPLVTDNPVLSLALFLLFAVLHLFANYKAVRSVVMETFNEARLSIVLRRYLRDGRILSPLEANRREPVFLQFGKTSQIKLGVSLQDVVQSPEELNLALKDNNMPFLLGVRNGCVCVCLGPGASVADEIRAACQAVCASDMLTSPASLKSKQTSMWETVHESHKLMDAHFAPFLKGVEAAGWDTNRTLLDWDEWRAEWKTKSS